LQIGPIPKGTPISLIANIQLLAESPYLEDKAKHAKQLFGVLLKLKQALKSLPENPSDMEASKALAPLVDDLISISKCPDYIVNKGHYFGSNLSDDDKNALIELLKTF
jgi:hypothetical protein